MRLQPRSVLALLASCIIAAGLIGPTAAAAQAPDVFLVFAGDADSYAASVDMKFDAGAPVPFDLFITRTGGHIDSQPRAQGFAATASSQIAELFATSFGFDPPPSACYSNSPGTEEAQCGGGQPVPVGDAAVDSGTAKTEAHADRDNPTNTNTNSRAVSSGSGAPGFSSGSSTSETTVEFVDGHVVATTVAVMQDINFGAGAFTIDQVRVSATTSTAGSPGSASAQASVSVSGAEVGGVPVRLTSTGIEVVDQPIALPGEVVDVLAPMAENGLTVAPLEPPVEETADDGRLAIARAEGPLISLTDGGGNRITYQIGIAESRSDAVAHERFQFRPPVIPVDPPIVEPPPTEDPVGSTPPPFVAPTTSPVVEPTPQAHTPEPDPRPDPDPDPVALTPGPPPPPDSTLGIRLQDAYGGAALVLGGLLAALAFPFLTPRFEGLNIRPEVPPS